MAIRKINGRSIDASATSTNLSIDAGTLYLDSSNNFVGLGTQSPNTRLHSVVSDGARVDIAKFEQSSQCALVVQGQQGNNDISGNNGIMLYTTGSGGALGFRTGTSGSAEMLLYPSGDLGIGTVTPSYCIDVQDGTRTAKVRIKSTSAAVQAGLILDGFDDSTTRRASRIDFKQNDVNKAFIIQDYPQSGSGKLDIGLQVGGTSKRMITLNTNGNIGFGTEDNAVAADTKLDARLDNAGGSSWIRIQNQDTTANSKAGLKMSTANGDWQIYANRSGGMFVDAPGVADVFDVNNYGQVAINTSQSSGRYSLYVNSSISTNMYYNSTCNVYEAGRYLDSRGVYVYVYRKEFINWGPSSANITVLRRSTDWNDWDNNFFKMNFHCAGYSGGGVAKCYWRLGYGANSFYNIYTSGQVNPSFTVSGANQVSGAPSDCQYFNLTWNAGTYDRLELELHTYQEIVSSITSYGQIQFL